MAKFEMKTSDLGELYILLKMYGDIYGNVPVGLMEDIACRYKQREKSIKKRKNGTGNIPTITNPRGAGRRSNVEQEEKEKILQLRKAGRTIREIGAETGRSSGYVHKLIHEHERWQNALRSGDDEKGHS